MTIAIPGYLHIISISPCFSLPNFMTSKCIQRNYFLADPKGIVLGRYGNGNGCLNSSALSFHILDLPCFPMTTYGAVMHRMSIDVPLILMSFPLVD